MSTINKKSDYLKTNEGSPAKHIGVELQLRRSVMACMLWEKSFYENGDDISIRICDLVHKNNPRFVLSIALEARYKMNLRHVPLLLCRELACHKDRNLIKFANVLAEVIQRPDELTEFLAIYWKDGRKPLSSQIKKGLAKAFTKFNEYQLAKYNRDSNIKLRDVLFLCHAKPKDKEQEMLWKRLIDDELQTPDTWEVALSAGQNKKETWERLIKENKLGGLAFLRNLRNMNDVKVDEQIIKDGLQKMNTERILPFRFIAAARYAPHLESEIEKVMFKNLELHPKMRGKTVLLVDVSGSMEGKLSSKSDMLRIDAACGLGILLREVCALVEIYTFSNELVRIPDRHGFALRDAMIFSQQHAQTYLGNALDKICSSENFDRIIVITDEQSHDRVRTPQHKPYMINVSTEINGVGYGGWTHIDGFSEAIIDYIQAFEDFPNS